jgi:hypothetical protein
MSSNPREYPWNTIIGTGVFLGEYFEDRNERKERDIGDAEGLCYESWK